MNETTNMATSTTVGNKEQSGNTCSQKIKLTLFTQVYIILHGDDKCCAAAVAAASLDCKLQNCKKAQRKSGKTLLTHKNRNICTYLYAEIEINGG